MPEALNEGVESASYWIACNNFYVLTRYNRSRLYAAAGYELAKALKAARGEVPRLVALVDSFEQVDGFDEDAAASPGEVLGMFEHAGASVLAIFA